MPTTSDNLWRRSTEKEILHYYTTEFPDQVTELPSWIAPSKPKEFAVALSQSAPVIPGKRSRSTKDFIRRSTKRNGGKPQFESWEEVCQFFQSPSHFDPLQGSSGGLKQPETPYRGIKENPLKESPDPQFPTTDAAYYSLQNHEQFWVLCFDIDAKDVAAEDARQGGDERSRREILSSNPFNDQPPVGYPYTFNHIEQAISHGFQLEGILCQKFDVSDTMVVYSGQGVHVYALDEDPAHRYPKQARMFIVEYLEREYEIPLDGQVTPDSSRVMRLPYSLHADVSRVVTPITTPDFDPRTSNQPSFLNLDQCQN